MAKLIHLHNQTAGAVPTTLEFGRLAMNNTDGKVFISNAAGTGVVTLYAGANGTVNSVNGVNPVSGAVTLTPANLGATTIGTSVFTAANQAAALSALGAVAASLLGGANGIAQLDGTSKVPLAQLPDAVLGGVNYKGTYNASTNTPALPTAAAANKGWYYVTNVAGTVTPPGQGSALTLTVGDWVISNGVTWDQVDAQDIVSSVAGKTGAVVLAAGDIASGVFTAARLGATPGNSLVHTTDASGNPTWVATVPTANLPTATTSALGLAQAGVGIAATAGVFSVDTTVLTMDEGTYS